MRPKPPPTFPPRPATPSPPKPVSTRELTSYLYFHIRPQRVQAWREVNELPGRELMRNGHWAVP